MLLTPVCKDWWTLHGFQNPNIAKPLTLNDRLSSGFCVCGQHSGAHTKRCGTAGGHTLQDFSHGRSHALPRNNDVIRLNAATNCRSKQP